MGVFVIIIGVLTLGFIICIIGLILSIRNKSKRTKLQKSADYNFKTKKGHYSFFYIIKGFNNSNGKTVKIVVTPEMGFSDLKTSETNELISLSAEVNGKLLDQTVESKNCLNKTLTIAVPANHLDNGVLNATFVVKTKWSLGNNLIEDVLEFTYNK